MKIPNGLRQINAFYGNPALPGTTKLNRDWYNANIVSCVLPTEWHMVLAWDTSQRVRRFPVHKLIVPTLETTMKEVWAHARIRAKDKYGYAESSDFYNTKTNEELTLAGMNLFGGSFNFRAKRGGTSLSMHSWGVALDFDPARNALGDTTPHMPLWVVDIFESNGWVWGGRWKGRGCDGMHFQLARGY
jgi:hypothetical protein